MNNFRQKAFDAILSDGEKTTKGDRFDKYITILIVLNVIAVVAESYPELEEKYHAFFMYFEFFSVIVFSIEYLIRIWTAPLLYPNTPQWKAILKFISSPLAIIDLLAVAPFYLPFIFIIDLRFIRILRLLRLLRVLKLSRHSESLRMISRVLRKSKSQLGVTFFVVFILIIVSASLMYYIEKDAQPGAFQNIGQGFWWAVATLTTVGYGDIYPITALGKLISGIIAILGIGLVALPTGIISSAFMDELSNDRNDEKLCSFDHSMMTTRYCPHCGERL
ncbi:MAG: ion transporter [Bacteroidota bacterium]